MVISLNSHNSSQEQDREMPQDTFFVQNNMLKEQSKWFYNFEIYIKIQIKGVFTPRTTLCSKLHLIIFKWMTALPVNEFAPYRSHNLLKITLWHLSASSKRHFLFTFKFYFLFCGKKWWFLVLWNILIQKHNWSETCTPSCEELWPFKEFALINKLLVSHAGKLSSV